MRNDSITKAEPAQRKTHSAPLPLAEVDVEGARTAVAWMGRGEADDERA